MRLARVHESNEESDAKPKRTPECLRRDPGTLLGRTLPYAQTDGACGGLAVLLGVASVLQPLAVFLRGRSFGTL